MTADAPNPAIGESRERTNHPRRVAVRRLEAALIEQARLGDGLQRAVATSSEQASYSRLRAASRRVSECDEAVKALSPERSPGAHART